MSENLPESQSPSPEAAARTPVRAWFNPWVLLALLALGLAFWQWAETRSRLADTQEAVAKKLVEATQIQQESRVAASQAQQQVAGLQSKIGALESKLAEFQGQTAALQGLYQDLAKSRDDATLLDVEQMVSLAAQQLQLAGNVQAAVAALQSADAKLARLDHAQFIPLRKAVTRDLDRLRALPFVDIAGVSVKLETIIASVDSLGLAMNERPRVTKAAPAPVKSDKTKVEKPKVPQWWEDLGSEVWDELRGLVRIQRFDRVEPVLLAPGQDFFLRENLKLRLLNARLALLSHDQTTFRSEVKVAREWLERHFDSRDRSVQIALATLKQLSSADINIELPNLSESLNAVKGFRLPREKK